MIHWPNASWCLWLFNARSILIFIKGFWRDVTRHSWTSMGTRSSLNMWRRTGCFYNWSYVYKVYLLVMAYGGLHLVKCTSLTFSFPILWLVDLLMIFPICVENKRINVVYSMSLFCVCTCRTTVASRRFYGDRCLSLTQCCPIWRGQTLYSSYWHSLSHPNLVGWPLPFLSSSHI